MENPFFQLEDDDVIWTGQIFGGLSYEVWDEIWVDATVRLLSLGEFEVGGETFDSSEDITVGLGIRFGF